MAISSDNLRSHAVRLQTWGWRLAIDAACAALNQAADYVDSLETTVRDAHALLAPTLAIDAPASVDTHTTA